MADHTPEPWQLVIEREDGSVWPKGIRTVHSDENSLHEWIVRDGWSDDFGNDQFANARRIVACVNACEGVPTASLEEAGEDFANMALDAGVVSIVDKLTAERDAARAEADRLRAALEAADARYHRSPNPFGHECDWCGDCCERVHEMRRAALGQEVRA